MKASRWRRCTAPIILISAPDGGEWSTKEPVPIEQEAGLTAETVWALSKREESVDSVGNRTPDHPGRCPVTIQTELPLKL
jgi:hypothetical protein